MYLLDNSNKIKTQLREVHWPALQNSHGGNLMGILYQLEHTQWYSPERLLEMQFEQLNELLTYVYQTIPFYRERLEEANITPSTKVDPDTWLKIPILTRSNIQEQENNLKSNNVPKTHGIVSTVRTSGSTGKPITVDKTAVCQVFWQAFNLRDCYWHKMDFQAKFAAIRDVKRDQFEITRYPKGLTTKNWGNPIAVLHNTGPGMLLNIRTVVQKQLDWLVRNKPEYVLTFASNAFALAEYAYHHNIELPSLRKFKTYGEVVDSKIRDMFRDAWDVPVIDMYSSEEIGYMALQCPEYEHYHIQSEGTYVEILNDQNQPCKPGEIGKIVVTPLHNFAMPLIRYAIGDHAEVGEPCPCGRGLPVIKRILGRTRNMFILPNGERHWAMNPYKFIMQVVPIRQYQIVQQTLEHIEFRLIVDNPVTPEQEDKLREVLRERYNNYPYKISFSYPDKIERSPNGKFEDFISKVAVNYN